MDVKLETLQDRVSRAKIEALRLRGESDVARQALDPGQQMICTTSDRERIARGLVL